ncbi:MAG: hypothetical protein EOP11_01590 [Proteobacteria bacterium]|nr:MAG: hypothetical protein EOP11_01590 [Pseudomonadota bacterium]
MKNTLVALLFIALPTLSFAKEAARTPASADKFCGIVKKVGSEEGQSFLLVADMKTRQNIRVALAMKGDALSHALSAGHASLNSMGKVFFCADRPTDGTELTLGSQSSFHVALYSDL